MGRVKLDSLDSLTQFVVGAQCRELASALRDLHGGFNLRGDHSAERPELVAKFRCELRSHPLFERGAQRGDGVEVVSGL
jgi:hypothetical protein